MTDALARALYRRGQPGMHLDGDTPDPVAPLTYGRAFFDVDLLRDRFTNRASGVVSRGVLTNHSVLVVGSGFGYEMEALIAAGVTDVWGIEPGPYFWDPANLTEWAPGMQVRTANDWVGSGTEVGALAALPGVGGQARFNWILDADAAPAHTDAELPAFIAGLEARLQGNARSRIVHLVSASLTTGFGGDSSQNWKTLADWQAVAPDHSWVNVRAL